MASLALIMDLAPGIDNCSVIKPAFGRYRCLFQSELILDQFTSAATTNYNINLWKTGTVNQRTAFVQGRIQGRGDMRPPWPSKAPRALVGALDGSRAPEGGFDPHGRSSLPSATAPSLGRSSEGTLDP